MLLPGESINEYMIFQKKDKKIPRNVTGEAVGFGKQLVI